MADLEPGCCLFCSPEPQAPQKFFENRFRSKASRPMVQDAVRSPHVLAASTPPNRSASSTSSASVSFNPSRGELPILQATTDLIKWFVPPQA
jgi:hypothetical protein